MQSGITKYKYKYNGQATELFQSWAITRYDISMAERVEIPLNYSRNVGRIARLSKLSDRRIHHISPLLYPLVATLIHLLPSFVPFG